MKNRVLGIGLLLSIVLAMPPRIASATVLYVAAAGGTPYPTITQAYNNATDGDTIKVLPGTYAEDLKVTKNVVIIGSGWQNTVWTSDRTPTVEPTIDLQNGRIQWFFISSNKLDGVQIYSGNLTNCVIRGCRNSGVFVKPAATGSVANCDVLFNGDRGVYANSDNSVSVFGCIARGNGNNDYDGTYYYNRLCVQYSNGVRWNGTTCDCNPSCNTTGDPGFDSDLRISSAPGAPCWDTGKPSELDPDLLHHCMGYYGGPYAPVFPVVTQLQLTAASGGGVTVSATAKATW